MKNSVLRICQAAKHTHKTKKIKESIDEKMRRKVTLLTLDLFLSWLPLDSVSLPKPPWLLQYKNVSAAPHENQYCISHPPVEINDPSRMGG